MKSHATTILTLCLIPFLFTTRAVVEARDMIMVGTYDEVSAEDEQLLASANFALTSFLAGDPDRTYNFSLGGSEGMSRDGVIVKIFDAEAQVVAGMNYKMTLGVFQDESCLGAFKVTVYDQFGDMSVTEWGDEVSCKDINETEEGYSFNFDFSEEDSDDGKDSENSSSGGNGYKSLSSISFIIASLLVISMMQ